MPTVLEKSARKPQKVEHRKTLSRDELVTSNMALVRHALDKIAVALPAHVDREDLLEAGMIGLIDAADRFDQDRNVRFSTYAMLRIRGAIFDALRREDWLPRSLRDEVDALRDARNELEHELNRHATDAELRARLNVDSKKLTKLERVSRASTFHSLDAMRENSEGTDFDPIYIERGIYNTPLDRAVFEEDKTRLADAMAHLPEKERLVISLYYFEEAPLRDIAKVLDVTASRVCQIHRSALTHLQGMMSKDGKLSASAAVA